MIAILKKISLAYYILFPNIFGLGYNQYKYSIIKKIITYGSKSVKLNNYLDERMVEIPWVINKLKKNKNKKILDVGCTLNFKYLIDFFLNNNEIFFINLFKEKNNFFSNQISYIQNDIRSSVFKDNYFDYVTAISVIEHIGFDKNISLIKIDVQGTELSVLRGARKLIQKNKPAILVEIDDSYYDSPREIRRSIKALFTSAEGQNDYEFYRIKFGDVKRPYLFLEKLDLGEAERVSDDVLMVPK